MLEQIKQSSLPVWVEKLLKENTEIGELDLSELGLNDQDLIEFAKLVLENKCTISRLNLYRNNIRGSTGVEALVKCGEKIGFIDFRYNSINDEGAFFLIKSSIKELDLSENNLTNETAELFLQLGEQRQFNIYRNREVDKLNVEKVHKKASTNSLNMSTKLSKFGLHASRTNSHQNEKSNKFLSEGKHNSYLMSSLSLSTENANLDCIDITIGDRPITLTLEQADNLFKILFTKLIKTDQKEKSSIINFVKDKLETLEQTSAMSK